MPMSSIVVLFLICGAFTVFALVLAWASHQTSNLPSQVPDASQGVGHAANSGPDLPKAA